MGQRRTARQRGQHAAGGKFVEDRHARFCITQTLLQRFGPKKVGQRQHDGANAVDRDLGDDGFRTLTQDQRYAVAALHAHTDQAVRKLVCGRGDPFVRPDLAAAGLILEKQGDAPCIGGAIGPPMAAFVTNVEVGRNQPAKRLVERLVLVRHTLIDSEVTLSPKHGLPCIATQLSVASEDEL